jgi:hypothetical protein
MSLPNSGMDAVPFTPLTAEFLDDMIENIESLADGSGLDNGAIKAKSIDFTTILLGSAATNTTIGYTTTSFADLTGLAVTSIVVPTGVTKLKVSAFFDNIDTNTAAGTTSSLRIIDESSTTVATTSSRQTASLAFQDSGMMCGLSTVSAGQTKSYKVQAKLTASGSANVSGMCLVLVEVVG